MSYYIIKDVNLELYASKYERKIINLVIRNGHFRYRTDEISIYWEIRTAYVAVLNG